MGQAYLTEKDLQVIGQSFEGQLQSEYLITLTDGDVVNINIIDSIEEIKADRLNINFRKYPDKPSVIGPIKMKPIKLLQLSFIIKLSIEQYEVLVVN